KRIGAPRLHECIAITEPHFSTKRISSRVAPASSAARIWRRVPSAFGFGQATFTATPASSMNFRGRAPLVPRVIVLFTQASAHFGSHSRSLLEAAVSHGPVVVARSSSALILISFAIAARGSRVESSLEEPDSTDVRYECADLSTGCWSDSNALWEPAGAI